ncbi:MAG: HEPN domain-containing protein [Cytophagales bacterium]|nr:HEPN domain-containing protein [Cytophagales bacterium]
MMDLWRTKNNSWALFMGHLVIEKLLKALYISKMNEHPPMIHDLRRICNKMEIELSEKNIRTLDTVSRFNISARYDDYRRTFYKLCTDSFTIEWISEIKACRLWIKKML